MSELRYWQRKARYAATFCAVLWLLFAAHSWAEGNYPVAVLFLAAHVLMGRDALRAHLALGRADR